jgi:hypothetical protein
MVGPATLATALALALATGCDFQSQPFDETDGEETATDAGGNGSGGSAGEGLGGMGAGGSAGDGQGGTTPMGPEGPVVNIRFRSTTAAFDHQDELAGQTPLEHRSSVRKLTLYRSATDPAPVTIFDLAESPVEISYDDGADSFVYAVPASSLPLGTFTIARAVHTHVRYRVATTMHVAGNDLVGELDCMQVLSDGTLVDGVLRDHGYYEYVFHTGGQSFPTSGTNAPLPTSPETGGFTAGLEEGEWIYTYAVELPITPDLADDVDVVLHVNMHESFRWSDEPAEGYAAGVFDTTPASFEPVLKFGANDYWMTLE